MNVPPPGAARPRTSTTAKSLTAQPAGDSGRYLPPAVRTRIKLEPANGGYALTPTPSQLDMFRWIVAFISDMEISDECMRLQVGQGRHGVAHLAAKLVEAEAGAPTECSIKDLHTLHAALMVTWNQILSEEAFYRRLGVFRENVIAVAHGMVTAISEAEKR